MSVPQSNNRRRAKGEDGGPDTNRWLLTYSDAITLMLVFFIILYAMSETDKEKFRRFVAAVQDGFSIFGYGGGQRPGQSSVSGPQSDGKSSVMESTGSVVGEKSQMQVSSQTGRVGVQDQPMTGIERMRAPQLRSARAAMQQLKALVGEDAWMVVNDREIRFVLVDSALFDSRFTELTSRGQKALEVVARVVRSSLGVVSVEGHTSASPPRRVVFEDNWSLSVAKAVLVVRHVVEMRAINGANIRAVGCGEHAPLADVGDRTDRRHGRIEVVIPLQ